jgi:tRNA(Ile)-lysidine synthase
MWTGTRYLLLAWWWITSCRLALRRSPPELPACCVNSVCLRWKCAPLKSLPLGSGPRPRPAMPGTLRWSPLLMTLAVTRSCSATHWMTRPSKSSWAWPVGPERVEVMPVLEEKLGPGVAESLARTAAILQQDADFLEDLADETYLSLVQRMEDGVWLPEDAVRELSAALRFRVIAKAAADVGGQQPGYGRLHAAEALLRRQGSAGPVELPGHVSVFRLSLSDLEQERSVSAGASWAVSAGAAADGVPRVASPCGKLVFRHQKPSQQ